MKTFALYFLFVLITACNGTKKESVIFKEKPESPAKNEQDDSAVGSYTALMDSSNSDDCQLTLELTKDKNCYNYLLKTNKRKVVGNAILGQNDSGEKYVILENIPWDEYEGDISLDESSLKTQDLEIPKEIAFLYQDDTLKTQNYGNSMNYYIKLGECDGKFIQLVKNKIPNSRS